MNALEMIRVHIVWVKEVQSIMPFLSDPTLTLEAQSILHSLALPQYLPHICCSWLQQSDQPSRFALD